jgi:hypothetical protein
VVPAALAQSAVNSNDPAVTGVFSPGVFAASEADLEPDAPPTVPALQPVSARDMARAAVTAARVERRVIERVSMAGQTNLERS